MKLAVAFIIGLAAISGGPASAQEAPVFTKNTRFRIPYRYDADEMQKLGAKEIRLFVSYDQGSQWQFVNRVAPQAGKFEFEAPGDGEYWFAVRTVDFQNRLHPEGVVNSPGLKVTVDSTAPTLDIRLSQLEPGKIELHWDARDGNIDLTTLKLESIEPGTSTWQQVSIVPQATGKTSWSVPEGGVVRVRGTVGDLASNAAFSETQVQIASRVSNKVPAFQPDFSQPVAGGSSPRMGKPSNGFSSSFVTDDVDRRPAIVRDRYAAPSTSQQTSGRSRLVNTPRFQIAYQVEDIGPSGLSGVEFYITENGGSKWFGYGNDPDRQSPFEVVVPRDGEYGFVLRARSGAGLAADPPQAGEKPSIVVVVDQTPPVAQLLGAQQGQGSDLSRILIRWNASDQHLADSPVSLSYATETVGPWKPISGWLANTGSFSWTIGPGVPPRMYIRLAVRDAAGNVTRVESSQPVVVDLSKPTARIVDVEAVQGL